ncbi:MAG: ABC transporter permease, partial [Bacteroidota bacterium]
GGFLANDRPIVAKYNGEIRWPAFRQIGESFGWVNAYGDLPGRTWRNAETDWAIWPPIPYAASTIDSQAGKYVSPFQKQQVESLGWRHWLGTDKFGRDVVAGLISGTRVAILVGLVAMLIALFIGLLIGGVSGYFGDDTLRWPRWRSLGLIVGLLGSLGYFTGSLWPFLQQHSWFIQFVASLFCLFICCVFFLGIFRLLSKGWPWLAQVRKVPLDALVLRMIELFNSIPGLVLLISLLAILNRPTILTVMIVIGLIRWTGIARFVRAELLRIRQLPYIEAARVSGYSDVRILVRHALPNALGPVIIAVAFGVAGAVLLEAFLSFLGIGLPPDQVSWGSLLAQTRRQASAWWLAVFPGLAIFLTVLCLNVVGESLRRA